LEKAFQSAQHNSGFRVIPEFEFEKFERLHGPGYQALIMVDNSQGHGIYALDALLTQDMNYKPGGAQPKL
jgi:hypothetical protein